MLHSLVGSMLTGEFDLLDELEGLSFGRDIVSLSSVVHESDLNTILIEE